MGLFSFLKEAASEANEEAHGSRLLDETQRMFVAMERIDGNLQHIAMCGYLEILDKLHREIPNHSREGRIKLGRIMQKQARERFDFDMAGSIAKLLAGVWLESKERTSLQAQQAHSMLEKFSEYVINEVGEVDQTETDSPNFDTWYLEFKIAASNHNRHLVMSDDEKSMIDFMDHEPLRRAYRDGVSPQTLGRQFAEQYDFSKFGS